MYIQSNVKKEKKKKKYTVSPCQYPLHKPLCKASEPHVFPLVMDNFVNREGHTRVPTYSNCMYHLN